MREGAQMGNLNELESDRTMVVNFKLELSLESMPVVSSELSAVFVFESLVFAGMI